MDETTAPGRLEFTRAAALTGRIVRHHAGPLLLMAVVLHAIPNFVISLGIGLMLGPVLHLGETNPDAASFLAKAIGVARNVVPLFTLYLLTAATLRHVFALREGRKAAIADSLSFALRHIGAAAGLAVLVFISTLAGLFLVVVPGVLIWLAWSAAAPIAVMERTNINTAVERSRALTRDNRGTLFLLNLLFFVGLFAVEGVVRVGGALWLTPTFDMPPQTAGFVIFAMAEAVEVFFAVLGAAGLTAIYIQLRAFDAVSDATAEVFG